MLHDLRLLNFPPLIQVFNLKAADCTRVIQDVLEHFQRAERLAVRAKNNVSGQEICTAMAIPVLVFFQNVHECDSAAILLQVVQHQLAVGVQGILNFAVDRFPELQSDRDIVELDVRFEFLAQVEVLVVDDIGHINDFVVVMRLQTGNVDFRVAKRVQLIADRLLDMADLVFLLLEQVLHVPIAPLFVLVDDAP